MPIHLNRAARGMFAGIAFGLVWNLIGAFSLEPPKRLTVLGVVAAMAAILAVAIVRSSRQRIRTSAVNRAWLAFSIIGEIILIVAALLYCNLAARPGLINSHTVRPCQT